MDSQDGLVKEKGLFDAETGVDYLSDFVEMSKSTINRGVDVIDSIKSYSYEPVVCHWFYVKEVDKKCWWKPFSFLDSVALEDAYQHLIEGAISDDEAIVNTDGGRYDVHISQRIRTAIYWEEAPTEVRRCSWFFKGPLEANYTPYEEEMAEKLEEEYHKAVDRNLWHRILEFPHGEKITFQTPNVMLHFPNTGSVDDWNQVTDRQMQALIVKRGIEAFDISDGESTTIDHLIFLVHGIGSVCDFRFRPIVEVVDDFRALSYQLLRSHFPSAVDASKVGRIEFLPVSWHAPLHGDDTGIDKRLQPITLPSIPKLRHFANDTILDVLFYTSPVYCETIISTVGLELNRLYNTFMQRNPAFQGQISLGGHSLGSLILFDLLAHQPMAKNRDNGDNVDEKLPEDSGSGTPDLADPSLEEVCQVLQLGDYLPIFEKEQLTFSDLLLCSDEDLSTLSLPMGPRKRLLTYLRDVELRRANLKQNGGSVVCNASSVGYTVGLAGTGQPSVSYPLLNFKPAAFYALGSPVAMFVTVRGIDRLGEDFIFPTCPKFFNIFHPYDPVAYRIETLIDAKMVDIPPVLIPHHKGRKRMHIELKETITRVSADFERFLGSVRSTWNNLASFRSASVTSETNKTELELISEDERETDSPSVDESRSEAEIRIGKLNGGNRIDFVLQEAPLESFNEYLFALTSHVGYWESEDTMLLILKETYSSVGVYPDKCAA